MKTNTERIYKKKEGEFRVITVVCTGQQQKVCSGGLWAMRHSRKGNSACEGYYIKEYQ